MLTYTILETTENHIHVTLARGERLYDALVNYIVAICGVQWLDDGTISLADQVYSHPLEFVESYIKFNAEYDELQIDSTSYALLNPNSLEIRRLPDDALAATCSSIFTTADPSCVSGYYDACRAKLNEDRPGASATGFIWYLKSGPLITFADRGLGGRFRVIERYLLRSDAVLGPISAAVERWTGSYSDLLEQFKVDFPF